MIQLTITCNVIKSLKIEVISCQKIFEACEIGWCHMGMIHACVANVYMSTTNVEGSTQMWLTWAEMKQIFSWTKVKIFLSFSSLKSNNWL